MNAKKIFNSVRSKTAPSYAAAALLAPAILFAGSAQASLIGDTVRVEHYFPDSSTPFEGFDVTVQEGAGDSVTFFGYETDYQVNVEAASILVNFLNNTSWTPASFNGLVVSDLDWIDFPGGEVIGVTVDTNMVGYTNDRTSFTPDSVAFNWQDLPFTTNTFFNATLEVRHEQVPEPSLTLALLGGGAAVGFGDFFKRQLNKQQKDKNQDQG